MKNLGMAKQCGVNEWFCERYEVQSEQEGNYNNKHYLMSQNEVKNKEK